MVKDNGTGELKLELKFEQIDQTVQEISYMV